MKHSEFLKLVAALDSNYRSQPADKFSLEVWFRNLQDLDYKIAGKAIQQIMLTNKYYPTPAEIREAYTAITKGNRMTGLQAYEIFNQYCDKGVYTDRQNIDRLKTEYPQVYNIAKAIGFTALHSGNENFIRPEFERMFEKYQDCDFKQNMLPVGFMAECQQISGKVALLVEGGDIE